MTSRPEQITDAIRARVEREGLWDLRLHDVDLETMGEEIEEVLGPSDPGIVRLAEEEASHIRMALNMATGALISARVGDASPDGLRFVQDVVESALKTLGVASVRSASPHPFAEALGATVGGVRNSDDTWTCSCGESGPDDMWLWMHRRHDPLHKMEAST